MTTFAIGDIHGCVVALRTLLGVTPPGLDDLVVTLGDYVDVGPDVPGVLDRLIALGRETTLVALRGNHDQMMLDARRDRFALEAWRSVGGAVTLDAYGGTLDAVPPAHWAFLEATVDWHETPTHLFVHGGLDADTHPREQPRPVLHWSSITACPPHQSGKTVICGHTRQKSGLPLNLGHAVCLDTSAAKGGWLTCMDVDRGVAYQANEAGETRRLSRPAT